MRRVARHPECTDADWSRLKEQCEAEGFRLELVPELEFIACLREVYEGCKVVRAQRQAVAERADQDVKLCVLGVGIHEQALTCNFWRDKRGNLLSAEHEFVSEASAFYGATDVQIATVLYPLEMESGRAAQHDAALAKVRKARQELRKRRVVAAR